MAEVHYFQRYSQPENVVTNNTLLLFSRIQVTDPRIFDLTLKALFGGESDQLYMSVGAQVQQQSTTQTGGVVDGELYQQSFRIVIETKLTPTFPMDQLKRHLGRFQVSDNSKILLLLAPERVAVDLLLPDRQGVAVVSRTFADIITACREAGAQDNLLLRELVEDFEAYCFDAKLVSGAADRMMVVAAGETMNDNRELRLYYSPCTRTYQSHSFIGLYSDKAVRAIGQLENVIAADLVNGELTINQCDNAVTDDQVNRIRRAMDTAPGHGYDVYLARRFFLVEEFVETHFRKTSSGGMFSRRYFDLRSELEVPAKQPLPSVRQIAEELRNKDWS